MNITLAPGEEFPVSHSGTSFYFRSGAGPIEVEVWNMDDSQGEVNLYAPGSGLRGTQKFKSLTITNVHNETQDIEIYVGSRDYVDNRNVGVVQVEGVVGVDVQREGSTVYAGIAGSVGKYSSAALINPAGSGVKLLLEKVRWSISSNSIARLSINADTPAGWTDYATTPLQQGSEVIKRGNHSGAVIAEYDVMGSYIAGYRVHEFSPPSPIVLLEGDSAWARVDLVGATFYPEFSWVEEEV